MSELKFEDRENYLVVLEKKEKKMRDLKGRRTKKTKYHEIAKIPKDKEKANKIAGKIVEKIIRPPEPEPKSMRQRMDEAYGR